MVSDPVGVRSTRIRPVDDEPKLWSVRDARRLGMGKRQSMQEREDEFSLSLRKGRSGEEEGEARYNDRGVELGGHRERRGKK